jgi:hypothetical protein
MLGEERFLNGGRGAIVRLTTDRWNGYLRENRHENGNKNNQNGHEMCMKT